MIELDSVQNRFFNCRFVQTRKSCANMQLFIISNINFVGKYRVPRMRFQYFLLCVRRFVCKGRDYVSPCRLGPSKITSNIRKVLISAGLTQMIYYHTNRYSISAPEAMPFLAVKPNNTSMSPTALNQQFGVNRVKVRRPNKHYSTRCALRTPPCS